MKRLIRSLLSMALSVFVGLNTVCAVFAQETLVLERIEPIWVVAEATSESIQIEDYLLSRFYSEKKARNILGAGQRLDSNTRFIYDIAVPFVREIAQGERSLAYLKIQAQELENKGMNIVLVGNTSQEKAASLEQMVNWRSFLSALLHDCAYELYWFDKTCGIRVSATTTKRDNETVVDTFLLAFPVVEDLQGEGYTFSDDCTPVVDTTMAIRAEQAVENAQQIVDKYACLRDYEKVIAYKDAICALVRYDREATISGSFSRDADPWQLLNVFDGDPSTNVVCEGYAKAFQYLCELTDFTGNVHCWTATGTTGEPHMWNIVTLDGKNYLADVTNSDENTMGSDGSLFLAGGKGSLEEGYWTAHGMHYRYDASVLALWGSEENSILRLSPDDYIPEELPEDTAEPPEDATEPPDDVQTEPERVETVPMYRLYNPNSGEHFYTGSEEERNELTVVGWYYEGISWNAPRKGGNPVYRVFNPNAGDHHYTMSWTEVTNLVAVGWNYEGVAWNSASDDNIPLFRLWNPNAQSGTHHYTGSEEERDNLVRIGWILEGIGWFGMLK